MSRKYWELAAAWHSQADQADAARSAQIEAAERFVRLAEQAPTEMNAFSYYRSAVQAYRKIGGTDERRDELHQQMLSAGEGISGEMGHFSWDPTNEARQDEARSHVQGAVLHEALTRFALGHTPPPKDHYEERALKEAQWNPLKALAPAELQNAMGHVIETKPGGFEDDEAALQYLMHDVASRARHEVAVNYIRPAKKQMLEDHYIGRRAIADFLQHSTFVPTRRMRSFVTGLYQLLNEEWLVCRLAVSAPSRSSPNR